MAFDKTGLALQYFGGASAVRVWTYTTADDLATVQGVGYFSDSQLEPADMVMVMVVDSVRYPTATLESAHLTVDAAGTATLSTSAATGSGSSALTLRTAA